MAKKWKNKKVKLLSFQKDLQILLSEYDYYMDSILVITRKAITSQIVVDTPPEQVKQPPIRIKNVKKRPSKKSKKK